jgi:tRNA(Ile)-lysidine synthase
MLLKRGLPTIREATKLKDFEYRVFRRLKALNVAGARILVGCSGGVDSVALVHCLAVVAKRLDLTIEVASLHHGPSKVLKIKTARAAAISKVKAFARNLGLKFHTRRSVMELLSEEALRDFRHEALRDIAAKNSCEIIAVAHHASDLLETRLIRLIRGTGPQGLRSMRERELSGILRPFLAEERENILTYAKACSLKWHEDPTNVDSGPLRNWIRTIWLPLLEGKRKGSTRSLARSLAALADGVSPLLESTSATLLTQSFAQSVNLIDRKSYDQLGISERRSLLAATLLKFGTRDFGASHIEEIRKRVEAPRNTRQKRRSFRLLDLDWEVNAQQIVVRRIKSLSTREPGET